MYTSGIKTMLSRTIRMHLQVKQETEVHFLVGSVILRFLSIFRKSKASSHFEALNSMCLSMCQSDVIPPVQMRRRPTAFSRVSTGYSYIPSSCDMKHEPKFKPLHGNPAFFDSGLSRYIPLETESTESLSPTYCWGKTPLEVLVENWLTSSVKDRESARIFRPYVVHGTFFTLLCWNEYSYRLQACVSENLCSFLKEVKLLVLYSVEHGIAMEPMKRKWA